MLKRVIFVAYMMVILALLAACSGAASKTSEIAKSIASEASSPTEKMGGQAETTESTSATETGGEGQTVEADGSTVETDDVAPTDTPPPPEPTPEPLFYNLPSAVLTNPSGLYASPNRSELIAPVPIPEGEKVFIMGRNATRTHLRVVWNTGVGWIPVGFTSYNNNRNKLDALPVFEREPPKCAIPLTTQFGLNSQWETDVKQRVAVVVDLFRSRFGEFPRSSLSLTVNGQEVPSTRRQIVEQGQFSLKDIVFTLDQDLQPGDVLGYLLDTESDEPLTFMATIFSVPSNCVWETK